MMPAVTMWRWLNSTIAKRAETLQYQTYIKSLLQNLGEYSQIVGREDLLRIRVHELYQEAKRRHSGLIVDRRSETHLQVACLVASAYKTLLPWFGNDQDKVIDLIRKPLGASASGIVAISQKIALFFNFNKFSFISRSLNYMDSDFGQSFSIAHHIMLDYHRISVTRCLYHTVFTKDGLPELTPIFCALDRMWFDQVHPSYGIKFSRPNTLADGNKSCEFIVQRTNSKVHLTKPNTEK